jgi:hypothetical protein
MLSVQANSGRPFNITTGRDDNGDTVTNDRPSGIPRNSGEGPGRYNMSVNLSRTFNLRRQEQASPAGNSLAEPQRGGGFPGGGQRGGGPGGGRDGRPNFPGGGDRRPGGFGSPNGPRMTFNVRIENLLNNTQLRSYSGVLTSPFFGMATSAQNGRSINLGLNFSF